MTDLYNKEDSYTPYILQAIGIYAGLIIFFYSGIKIFEFLGPKPIVSAPALKVSLVAMPDKITQQHRVSKSSSKRKKKKIKDGAGKYSAKKSRSRLEKILKRKQLEASKTAEAKGNTLSDGVSLTGVQKIEFNAYVDRITEEVKSNWALPSWVNSESLKAEVKVLIAATGTILRAEIIKSSGNTTFDQSALASVRQAAPFAYPPTEILLHLSKKGVTFVFP